MTNTNDDMKLMDVGAPVMIPKGNLNLSQPASFAAMRKALDDGFNSKNTFKSSTSYGFKPGYKNVGSLDNVCWGCATFK